MSERTPEPPAPDRLPPTDEDAHPPTPGSPPSAGPRSKAPPPGAPPDEALADAAAEEAPTADTEQRPLGALAVTTFLVVAILVSWFGMYALNVVRN